MYYNAFWKHNFILINSLIKFFLYMAVPTAHGSSQDRGWIRAAAAGLHHSHSNMGSPTHWAEPTSSWILVRFMTCWATTGTVAMHVEGEVGWGCLGIAASLIPSSPEQVLTYLLLPGILQGTGGLGLCHTSGSSPLSDWADQPPLPWSFLPTFTLAGWGRKVGFFVCFGVFLPFLRAAPAAYGDSWARGLIRAVATSLHHSHSSSGSELCLWPTPQLMATLDP